MFENLKTPARARQTQGDDVVIKPHTTSINIITIIAAATASFTFGYTNNAISGTLAQESFNTAFLSGDDASSLIGGILGGFFGGALIGAIIQSPVSSRWGRKRATYLAALFVAVSSALLAGSVHIAMFIVARILNGMGAGMLLSNTPVYMSEISPAHTRGSMVSSHGMTITFSYIISALVALGFHFVETSYAWRLQFVVVTALAFILMVVVYFIPESPRWLIDHDRADEGWTVLQRLHSTKADPDARLARAEFLQIRAQLEQERSLDTSYYYIFTNPSTRKRAICGAFVWFMGQSTGILVIANFAPLLFGGLGFDVTMQLGLTVAWLAICQIGTVFSTMLVDRLGRVKLLVLGGYTCSLCLIIEALLQKEYIGTDNHAGLSAATFIYFVFVFVFGLFIECPAYAYIVEIWPTHLRSQGATIGTVAFFSTTLAFNTPASLAFSTIGWRYYFVFVSVTLVAATIMLFYLPETAGLTLEEIAARFGDKVVVEMDKVDIDAVVIEAKTGLSSHTENTNENRV